MQHISGVQSKGSLKISELGVLLQAVLVEQSPLVPDGNPEAMELQVSPRGAAAGVPPVVVSKALPTK